MSERIIVLVPAKGSALRWRRVNADGVNLEAGLLVGDAVLNPGEGVRVTAVVPGSAVSVHWIDLPRASAAQAAAAARLLAADFVAVALDDQHVAAAVAADADGMRIIAIAAHRHMQDWLAMLARHGLDPDDMVPAPLLLPVPGDDAVATLRAGDSLLVRSHRLAFEAEPALAEMMFAARRPEPVLRDLLDLAALTPVDALPVNLRQGAYRRAGDGQIDGRILRRLGGLAAACVLAFIATDAVRAVRYSIAADAAETEIAAISARLLPGSGAVADPVAAINRQLRVSGAAGGFTADAAALFAGLEASGTLRLESLRYTPDGGMRATLTGPVGVSLESLRIRLAGAGLGLVEGAVRGGEGGQRIDVEVSRP